MSVSYLGMRIRHFRKQDGLTQSELAKKLDVGKSTVSMWENGQRDPDYETLEAIADFFNVSISAFFPPSARVEKMSTPVSEGGHTENIVKIAGRDGRFVEKRLSDKELQALMAFVDLLPDAADDL